MKTYTNDNGLLRVDDTDKENPAFFTLEGLHKQEDAIKKRKTNDELLYAQTMGDREQELKEISDLITQCENLNCD